MNNQKKPWEQLHKEGRIDHFKEEPTGFAIEAQKIIPPHSNILELGCGVGNDSYHFAKMGHKVLGTDFSEVAIKENIKSFLDKNINGFFSRCSGLR